MGIMVKFEGGPADGVVQEYPSIDRALPSLYWQGDEPVGQRAVYHVLDDMPDPTTGLLRYGFSSQ